MPKKIRVFEMFAGIGAQKKAIQNIGGNFEIKKISDWYTGAIMAYGMIHHSLKYEKLLSKYKKIKKDELLSILSKDTYSTNSKEPSKLKTKNENYLRNLLVAKEISNNYPNIMEIKGCDINHIDLVTYSFPCQGLSNANMTGEKGLDNIKSTSNLLWQVDRILNEASDKKQKLPNFLLMENVPAIRSKKNKEVFKVWRDKLNQFGYQNIVIELNSYFTKSVQIRKRVFMISSLIKTDLNEEKILQMFENRYAKMKINKKKEFEKIFKYRKKYKQEYEDSVLNMTKSRKKMVKLAFEKKLILNDIEYKKNSVNTLTCRQDRWPNVGMLKYENKYRFITPREAFLLMGFENEDYDKMKKIIKDGLLTKEALYRLAGNSIVVPVLEFVFKIIQDINENKHSKKEIEYE